MTDNNTFEVEDGYSPNMTDNKTFEVEDGYSPYMTDNKTFEVEDGYSPYMTDNKTFEVEDGYSPNMTDNKTFEVEDGYSPNDNVADSSTANSESNKQRKLSQVFSIEKHMVPSKIVYSLAGAYTGSFVPFINVFLTSIGLTVSEAGFIGGIRLVSSAILGPVWGLLIDYTGRRKLIFVTLCLGTAFTIFSLPWTAQIIITRTNNNTFKYNENHHKPNKTIVPKIPPIKYGFTSPLFCAMLIIIFISNIFDVPLQGITDSFVMNAANSRKKGVTFGMQKVYHSVFFGIANFIAGLLADHYHHSKDMSKYTAVFFVFMPCTLLLIPAGLILLRQTKWLPNEKKQSNENTNDRKAKVLLKTFRHFDNIVFILSVFLVGVASAVLLGFLFMLMDHEMHASKSSMGLSVLVSCVVQVLLFPFSHNIIEKFGAIPCIELSLVSYFIRFMLVSYITNPWLIIPTQLFHCICFALFWAASIEHTQIISAKEVYCTMYSILTSVYYGIGGILGNIVGGFIFTHYGGRMLFRGTAILCAIWTVVMILYYQLFKKFVRNHQKKKGMEEP